jgi:hypothetical protein
MVVDAAEAGAGAGAGAAAAAAGVAGAGAGSAGFVPTALRPSGALASSVVLKEDEPRSQWWPVLHKRVVQHNIRVAAGAYTRVRFPRLAEVLGLDAPTTEAMVSELVSDKSIYARIDRPSGVVVFERPRPPTEVLSDWAADLEEVLGLVEKASHQIQKEYMVHGIVA